VLTVYEAKGLEFDDVILWNFFTDSKVDKGKWYLINKLFVENDWMSKEDFMKTVTMHEEEMLG
jgi:ATP-dependent exoDNAse (exonuclease V) beta subunit